MGRRDVRVASTVRVLAVLVLAGQCGAEKAWTMALQLCAAEVCHENQVEENSFWSTGGREESEDISGVRRPPYLDPFGQTVIKNTHPIQTVEAFSPFKTQQKSPPFSEENDTSAALCAAIPVASLFGGAGRSTLFGRTLWCAAMPRGPHTSSDRDPRALVDAVRGVKGTGGED